MFVSVSSEALPMLSYFQSRQTRPTAWKCNLEIGSELKIPCNGYIRVRLVKIRPKNYLYVSQAPPASLSTPGIKYFYCISSIHTEKLYIHLELSV